jgi:TM2 domain-containing membrane protein YozV
MAMSLHPDVRHFAPEVQSALQNLTPSQIAVFNAAYARRRKDPVLTLLLAILSPVLLPFDRFYLGDWLMGILKLLTVNGFLLWWLVDIVTAYRRTMERNERIAMELAVQVKQLIDPQASLALPAHQPTPTILIVLGVIAYLLALLAVVLWLSRLATLPFRP